MGIEFRNLRENEIKVRVAEVKPNYITLFTYVDASTVQDILDEAVTPTGWMRKHSNDNKNCTISIYDSEKNCWVEKEDVGTESRDDGKGNEAKGLATDSFKRSAKNWGIARELSTMPRLWFKPDGLANVNNGKCYDEFYVEQVMYRGKTIVAISIINKNKGKRVVTIDLRTAKEKEAGASSKTNTVADAID